MTRRLAASTRAERRARLVEIALALPEVERVEASGAQHLNFKARGKSFAWCVDDHHGDGRLALHCKASPGTNSALAEVHPERFHVPAYVGKQGWLGLWLDLASVDWSEVAEVLREGYALAAPPKSPKSAKSARVARKPKR